MATYIHTVRWLSLVAVIWLQSINGTNTNFPLYSSSLKKLLSLSQLQLNNLAFASDAGKLFGFISGIAALYLPLWLILFIGSTLGLIGYGLQYLFLRSLMHSYWIVFCLTVVAGNSICWINTVCYLVVVRNFPSHLQVAAGLSTSYVGLSAMIYTAVVNSAFHRSQVGPSAYLLLNAVAPLALSIIAAPFTRPIVGPIHGKSKELRIGFLVVTLITTSTGVLAMITSSLDYNSSGKKLMNLMICLAVPLVVPLGVFLRGFMVLNMRKLYTITKSLYSTSEIQTKRSVCDDSSFYSTSNRTNSTNTGADEEKSHTTTDNHGVDDHMPVMEEIGPKLMLKRLNFWLYFSMYFLGATIGLVYLNNLGQIAESRGCYDASSLVSLSSAFGFFGRLLPCLLHYIWSRCRRMVPGPACIFFLMIPLSGSIFLLLADGGKLFLSISTATVGFCTGAITTICVSVTAQLFGRKSFGVNHNLVVVNIPLGSFVLGDFAALLYRRAEVDLHMHVGGRSCVGLSCYRDTFLVWGSLSSLGTILAFILHLRTRQFYSRQYQ